MAYHSYQLHLLQNAAVTLVFWVEVPDLHCLVNSKIQDDNKNIKRIQVYCKAKNPPALQKSTEI